LICFFCKSDGKWPNTSISLHMYSLYSCIPICYLYMYSYKYQCVRLWKYIMLWIDKIPTTFSDLSTTVRMVILLMSIISRVSVNNPSILSNPFETVSHEICSSNRFYFIKPLNSPTDITICDNSNRLIMLVLNHSHSKVFITCFVNNIFEKCCLIYFQ